jgi:hypothetical protein
MRIGLQSILSSLGENGSLNLPEPTIVTLGENVSHDGYNEARYISKDLAVELQEAIQHALDSTKEIEFKGSDMGIQEIDRIMTKAWDEGTDAGTELDFLSSRGYIPTLEEVKKMHEMYPPTP